MKIKILGIGCAKCQALEKLATEVVQEVAIDADVEDIKEMKKIMEYPILTTPGLVIDEELVCSGRVPTKAEMTSYITTALSKQTD